jgi:hypothetical protein
LWRETYTTRTKRTRKKPHQKNPQKKINKFSSNTENEGKENLTVPETCRSEAAIDEGAKIAVRWKRAREKKTQSRQEAKKKRKDLMVSSPPSFRT